MESKVEIRVVSALEKVFSDTAPSPYPDIELTALRGEKVSFQLAYRIKGQPGQRIHNAKL